MKRTSAAHDITSLTDTPYCDAPIIGMRGRIDERGTQLIGLVPPMGQVWPTDVAEGLTVAAAAVLSGQAGLRLLFVAVSETAHGVAAHRCPYSETVDRFERPMQVEYFTPSTAEWVGSFALKAPPTFVPFEASRSSMERPDNVGLETVLWLREFFDTSQERACTYAQVPLATFYAWRKKPNSVVRPASVANALKLRASLERAVAELGEAEVQRALASGHPSISDRLLQRATWTAGIEQLQMLAAPAARTRRPRRMKREAAYLAALDALDVDSRETDSVTLGAEQMTAEQISEAQSWGWGE